MKFSPRRVFALLIALVMTIGCLPLDVMAEAVDYKGVSLRGVLNQYTVTFEDFNGNVLKTQEGVPAGGDAVPPEDPVQSGYTFIGWDKPFTGITADTTVTAQYEENGDYGVARFGVLLDGKWTTFDTSSISFWDSRSDYYYLGNIGTKTYQGERFNSWRWDTAENGSFNNSFTNTDSNNRPNRFTAYSGTGGIYVRPVSGYEFYTVTFQQISGSDVAVLKTQIVQKGAAASAPAQSALTIPEGQLFDGWDVAFDNVTARLTVTAQFTPAVTAVFQDAEGNELKTQSLASGQTATPPALEAREGYTSGWYVNGVLTTDFTVTQNTVFTAKYNINTYSVAFTDYDGSPVGDAQTIEHGSDAAAPADPAHEGFIFAGWYENGEKVTDFTGITSAHTYIARYAHSVVFMNRGSIYSEQTVEHDGDASVPADPQADAGQTFLGWYENGEKVTDFTGITLNRVFTAQYEAVTYTVSFVDFNGVTIDAQQVEYGADAVAPANPTREGYTFTGWDKSFNDVTADLTVVAQYAPAVYTVTFTDADETVLKQQPVAYLGTAVAPALAVPDGYTFLGWFENDTVVTDFTGIVSNRTFTARYEKDAALSYTVIFYDYDMQTVLSEQTVAHGEAAEAPDDPEREGYLFIGWNPADFTSITADTDIVAQYAEAAAEQCVVTFLDWNGALLASYNVDMYTSPYGLYNAAAPVRTGYTFKGFADGNNVLIDQNTAHIVGNTTFRASYAPIVYTLTVQFVLEGTDMLLANPTVRVLTYDHPAYYVAAPVIPGYSADVDGISGNLKTDSGWDEHNAKTVSIEYSTSSVNYTVRIYHEVVVQGADESKNYALVEEKFLTAETGETVTYTATPYAGFTPINETVSGVVAADGSTVLSVNYRRNTYTIIFDSTGGTYIEPIVARFGAPLEGMPDDPDRAGYTFSGWTMPQSWNGQLPAAMPSESVTLTANWTGKVVPYTVVYWIENANPDSDGTYGYTYHSTDDTKTAVAGSTVGESVNNSFSKKTIQYFTYGSATDVTVKGDGSTILNVKYTRNSYTLSFTKGTTDADNVKIEVNGAERNLEGYTFTAKYESDISDKWPSNAYYYSNYGRVTRSKGWDGNGSNTYASKRLTLTTDLFYEDGIRTFTALWGGSYKVNLYYMIESLDGTGEVYNNKPYKEDPLYTQKNLATDSTTWNAKQISGVTNVGQQNFSETGVDNAIKFYYTRNSYDIEFYSGETVVKTEKYKFGADITELSSYVPPRPASLPDTYTFGGWYTVEDCYPGSEFNWTNAKMPPNNLLLYAAWNAPTHDVTYKVQYMLDDGSMYDIVYGDPVTVPSGESLTEPENPPTRDGYVFDGWYTDGGKPFVFGTQLVTRDMVLIAHWRLASDRTYTVYYRYSDGTNALDPKVVENQTFMASVTETAPVIPGYVFDKQSKSITITMGVNEIIFIYSPPGELTYSVYYYLSGTEEFVPGYETPIVKTVQGQTFVVSVAGDIPGYSPDAWYKVKTLGTDASANIIIFYYTKNPTAQYTVEYYVYDYAAGEYAKDDSYTREAPVNSFVTADEKAYTGYILDASSNASGVVAAAGDLVLRLYYRYPGYTIHHYLRGTTTKVAEDETGHQALGTEIAAAEATNKQIAAATLNSFSPAGGKINLVADESQNVIYVYYYIPLTVKANSQSWTYDGNVHTPDAPGYTINDTANILTGDTITPTLNDAKIQNVGTVDHVVLSVNGVEFGENDTIDVGYYQIARVDGELEIVPLDTVVVTIVGNTQTVTYDGEAHTITGYTVTTNNELYGEADFTFSGDATAERTIAGTTYMGLLAEQFENSNGNFEDVEFDVTDGWIKIVPVDTVKVTIVGNTQTVTYDGEAHTITGYTVTTNNELYGEADFTFSGDATAERTIAGTTYMGLTAGQFENSNGNFEDVEFDVTDGWIKIVPVDTVKVTIVGNTQTVTYDGEAHTITGYTVTTNNELYGEADFTFSGDATAERTIAGTTYMGLLAEQFENSNGNFEDVEFDVTDGWIKIVPVDTVKVTIVGNTQTVTYDGEAHTITGYTVTTNNELYGEADFTFSGDATAERTIAGTTYMGLLAEQFENSNGNFEDVEFDVTDGWIKIVPVDTVKVTIVGNTQTVTYDGEAHTITGYTVTTNNELYGEADFTFSGDATAERTIAGTTYMGLLAEQFENSNGNFEDVEFDVTDGWIKIVPVDTVKVTIVGNTQTVTYDGEAHTITGYTVTTNNELYGEADFTFSGDATAERTIAGTTYMGLLAEQFENSNGNFEDVEFDVTDGWIKIVPVDTVKVTIVGNTQTVTYDGEAHTITGYTVTTNNELYGEADFTFSGDATAERTIAGTTYMGLLAEQFENSNGNFEDVEFDVTDGWIKIVPVDTVKVTIVGNTQTVTYDGEAHTITGYTVTTNNELYGEADFTFSGDATAERTIAGTTYMGLTAGQFENSNGNFEDVEFDVTDGWIKIVPVDTVKVTIVGNTQTVTYDGEAHTITGYTVTTNNELYGEADFTFSGDATAERTIAGTTYMGLLAEQFENSNGNFEDVEFDVTDGWIKIVPVDTVKVTIVGNTQTVTYDGEAHTITGYTVTTNNELYGEADFTFSGDATAERTIAGTTYMGLLAEQFENSNGNFEDVEFDVTDGWIKIVPVDTVKVTIVGNTQTVTYDGEAHTITGYTVTTNNELYGEADFTFSGDATAERTIAGTTYMGLLAEQFENSNGNFEDVEFDVTDGWIKIVPVDTVKVTIVGNTQTVTYDGEAHTITGYTVTTNNELYGEADFTFSGDATAERTIAGTTYMGLLAEQFENSNGNFEDVEFDVTDGWIKIVPVDTVKVTIVGNTQTVTYDGEAHTITGYTVTTNNELYGEADFTFSGDATAERTIAGTTYMGLLAEQFENSNGNFEDVEFDVTDGWIKIVPVDTVKVTIVGNTQTVTYDGEAHTITGYTVTTNNELYGEADFTFSGDATAERTIAGTTYMGLLAEQFENSNGNFEDVEFDVTDGWIKIVPVDTVKVTIVGNTQTVTYDGEAHTITGYTVTTNNELYGEADFTFSGDATAERTIAGTTYMGLLAEQFENSNGNFEDVEFDVTDGWIKIVPVDTVKVTIVGNTQTVTYDGEAHTITGYTVTTNNELYGEADFTFSGDATAERTIAGTTYMGLTAGQFENSNGNFEDVEFDVTDGWIKIVPVDTVKVTIVGNTQTVTYDGEAHTITGYTVTTNNELYGEADFTFSGDATAERTIAGTTYMGLLAEQFENSNGNFEDVEFDVTDGWIKIVPVDTVKVTIVGNTQTVTYDGEAHTITGYTVTTNNELYGEADFTFSGDATAERTIAGTTYMGLLAEQFENSNGNFEDVEFDVTDGWIKIVPVDTVKVTIVGNTQTVTYDGEAHTITGYTVTTNNELYGEADFTFSGDATAERTIAGTTYMGLLAEQFENSNGNFEDVEFDVTDGWIKIVPVDTVKVTIVGNTQTVTYDGEAHTITGYTVTTNNELYGEADFTFSGDATAERTIAGTTYMGLLAEQFENSNGNFEDVEFDVTDGWIKIVPVDTVKVTIVGNTQTVTYDGEAHTITGYTVTTNNELYGEADFTFSGDATAERTIAGTTYMGLLAEQFENSNGNFEDVEFDVTDGWIKIVPVDTVKVTIVGNTQTVTYDGEAHTITGYTVTTNNELYGEADFTFSGDATAERTIAGTTYMGLLAEQFENSNGNFEDVEFDVTDGWIKIVPVDTVKVTIVGNTQTVTYDGEAHTITGYTVTTNNELYGEADFTFSGDATAERTIAGTTYMGLLAEQFENSNGNFEDVEFDVTDGWIKIVPVDTVKVTIVGNTQTVTYDGEAHTITGYTVTTNNELYGEADFTFSGDATAERTIAGTTYMGLLAEQFENSNGNFEDVEFDVTDGWIKIVPVDTVKVTIVGNTQTVTYDGEAHTITGYTVTTNNELYGEADFTFSGDATAERTIAGTTYMGLLAEQFENSNGNFEDVEFDVTDGWIKIVPVDTVKVTIVGNTQTVTYDGEAHTITGYTVTTNNELYGEADFTFSGDATAERTIAGTTYMGLLAEQFENSNGNFEDVEFDVTDGWIKIVPVDTVKVTIVGNTQTVTYDGEAHTITGYTVTTNNELYGEADFTFSGDATAERTIAGTTYMGLLAEQFENSNGNFEDVEFDVTDGWIKIVPVDTVKVTIVGNTQTVTYDGEAHTITGYTVTTNNELYGEADFTFSGDATAERTIAGTTYMGLLAEQFENSNGNFEDVEFDVTDGWIKIVPVDTVKVTIVGNTQTVTYDGEAHTITGYTVTTNNELYGEADFTFSGDATAERTIAGTTYMGLLAEQFENSNGNFEDVEFDVTDGWIKIVPVDTVKVTIVGNTQTVTYDGEAHTITGYTVTTNNELYGEADFTFSGDATAERTIAGTTYMGLTAGQFENSNGNFKDVEFDVTDGWVEIVPVDTVKVTIVGNTLTVTYDGEAHTITGYTVTTNNELYGEADFTFSGDATAERTIAGTTYMGLLAEQFENSNGNFEDVEFDVTDGWLLIDPQAVTVKADDKAKTEGDVDPELTVTITGLIGEDEIIYTTDRADGETAGDYVITPTGDEVQGNYTVTYETGTLRIIGGKTVESSDALIPDENTIGLDAGVALRNDFTELSFHDDLMIEIGTFNNANGVLTFTQTAPWTHAADENSHIYGQAIRIPVTVTIGDGTVDCDLLVRLTIVDDAPVANPDEPEPIVEDDFANSTINGNVLDNDDIGSDVPADFTGTVAWENPTAEALYGTITLADDGNYTYALDNDNAAVQALNAGETLAETFNYTFTDSDGDTTNSTLTITIMGVDDLVNITVEKIWDDLEDNDLLRPETITVQLFANDVFLEEATMQPNDAGEWTAHTWTDMPVYANGEKLTYTVVEPGVLGDAAVGYEVEYAYPAGGDSLIGDNAAIVDDETVNDEKTVQIINRHIPATMDVSILKVWDDDGNRDGLRGAYTVQLMRNGEAFMDPVTLTADVSLAYTWTDMLVFSNVDGVQVMNEYSVQETVVPEGYWATYNGVELDYAQAVVAGETGAITIINHHVIDVTGVSVRKFWNDDNDLNNLRPDFVTMNLLADGVVVASATRTFHDGSVYTFDDMPVYRDGGAPIVYSIVEAGVPFYASVTTLGVPGDTYFEITNTYNPLLIPDEDIPLAGLLNMNVGDCVE